MIVIFVRNIKRRTILLVSIAAVCLLIFTLSQAILYDKLLNTLTIDDSFSFSYPIDFSVKNIFFDRSAGNGVVEAAFLMEKPILRDFKTYVSPDGDFSFSYPSAFILSKKDFPGSEILYHIDFSSKNHDANGFIQVWHLPYSLKDFLEMSKQASQYSYISFVMKPISVNGLNGYYWDYIVSNNSEGNQKGMEVFLKKGEKMYRISYFTPENKWNSEQAGIFWSMVQSFKVR